MQIESNRVPVLYVMCPWQRALTTNQTRRHAIHSHRIEPTLFSSHRHTATTIHSFGSGCEREKTHFANCICLHHFITEINAREFSRLHDVRSNAF